ncbi:hypothetical protein ACFLW1_02465 [Chloroflexota bacterium]
METMLYTGAGLIMLWGVAHLIPTKAIVAGFGEISRDNRLIITMESVAEGMTLVFLGLLVVLVTALTGSREGASLIVYVACAVMLLLMALLTLLTGARTALLPYKLCPVVKTISAVLILLGAVV